MVFRENDSQTHPQFEGSPARGTTKRSPVPLDDYAFHLSQIYLGTELVTRDFLGCGSSNPPGSKAPFLVKSPSQHAVERLQS